MIRDLFSHHVIQYIKAVDRELRLPECQGKALMECCNSFPFENIIFIYLLNLRAHCCRLGWLGHACASITRTRRFVQPGALFIHNVNVASLEVDGKTHRELIQALVNELNALLKCESGFPPSVEGREHVVGRIAVGSVRE